jgi:hypothetical protein
MDHLLQKRKRELTDILINFENKLLKVNYRYISKYGNRIHF